MNRIVIYAEGAGEAIGLVTQLPPVGEMLRDEMLGAVHVLVRRTLALEWSIEEADIRFDSPLRTRGRMPRGSDLLHRATLKELLSSWIKESQRPDLVVVLVDADGESQRRTFLEAMIREFALRQTTIVGVAVQEFESWLLADDQVLQKLFGERVPNSDVENWPKRAAKQRIIALLKEDARGIEGRLRRRQIAEELDLDLLRNRCTAFAEFRRDLRAAQH